MEGYKVQYKVRMWLLEIKLGFNYNENKTKFYLQGIHRKNIKCADQQQGLHKKQKSKSFEKSKQKYHKHICELSGQTILKEDHSNIVKFKQNNDVKAVT